MDLRNSTANGKRSGDPATIAAFRAGVKAYASYGAPLYAALCARCSDDPEIVALASHGVLSSRPVHLFSSVHYLLLHDPADPLARHFGTLTEKPAAPNAAFPEFARFCREHHTELQQLLETRTVQTTYVERCRALMPPLARAAEMAGEPLHLIEIGCSAGVLLTFDKYAYEVEGRYRVGREDAPLTLPMRVTGNAPLRIPAIGSRTGIDLHIVDVRSEIERRWMLALSFPEFREQQARLAVALDTVAATEIKMIEGDALDLLPAALAQTPDPVCVFHSACLFYWDKGSKGVLEKILLDASQHRDVVRVSIEPREDFETRYLEPEDPAKQPNRPSGEVAIARYRKGKVERQQVGRTNPDYGVLEWID